MKNKIIPLYTQPTPKAVKFFGLIEDMYTLDIPGQYYGIVENSGIIQRGFTVDFYLQWRELFIDAEPEEQIDIYHKEKRRFG